MVHGIHLKDFVPTATDGQPSLGIVLIPYTLGTDTDTLHMVSDTGKFVASVHIVLLCVQNALM